MNALAFCHPSTSTVSKDSIVNPGLFNTLFDACCDTDLYESNEEPRPSFRLIKNAADALRSMPIAAAEIAPYFGELNITWKNSGNRVKAIFGPAPNSFSVYREQIADGRVTYHHMQANAEPKDLSTAIEWLFAPAQNVR